MIYQLNTLANLRRKKLFSKTHNFGHFIEKKLSELNRPQTFLIRKCLLSVGSIQRWKKGQAPSLLTFIIVCWQISIEEKVDTQQTIIEAIDFILGDV